METPSVKAKELFDRFVRITKYISENGKWIEDYDTAKICAEACCDEILWTLSPYMGDDNARDYWKSVKSEIENCK